VRDGVRPSIGDDCDNLVAAVRYGTVPDRARSATDRVRLIVTKCIVYEPRAVSLLCIWTLRGADAAAAEGSERIDWEMLVRVCVCVCVCMECVPWRANGDQLYGAQPPSETAEEEQSRDPWNIAFQPDPGKRQSDGCDPY
jgi:hypothetical protein